jgi:hypothetical protein
LRGPVLKSRLRQVYFQTGGFPRQANSSPNTAHARPRRFLSRGCGQPSTLFFYHSDCGQSRAV